jgi:hypothetical protein
MSISLCRSALKDSIEIYFVFVQVLLCFLWIFEVYSIFWNNKQKLKTWMNSAGPHWLAVSACRPSPSGDMAHGVVTARAPGAIVARSLRTVLTWWHASRRTGGARPMMRSCRWAPEGGGSPGRRWARWGRAGLNGPVGRQRGGLQRWLGGDDGVRWSTVSFGGSCSTRVGHGVRRGWWRPHDGEGLGMTWWIGAAVRQRGAVSIGPEPGCVGRRCAVAWGRGGRGADG